MVPFTLELHLISIASLSTGLHGDNGHPWLTPLVKLNPSDMSIIYDPTVNVSVDNFYPFS